MFLESGGKQFTLFQPPSRPKYTYTQFHLFAANGNGWQTITDKRRDLGK